MLVALHFTPVSKWVVVSNYRSFEACELVDTLLMVEVEGLERTVCLSGHATIGANTLPQTNTKKKQQTKR